MKTSGVLTMILRFPELRRRVRRTTTTTLETLFSPIMRAMKAGVSESQSIVTKALDLQEDLVRETAR